MIDTSMHKRDYLKQITAHSVVFSLVPVFDESTIMLEPNDWGYLP